MLMPTDHSLLQKALLILFGLPIILSACASTLVVEQETFDGEAAFQHVKKQVSFGPRSPGSDAHRLTGDYILETLRSNGWEVAEQTFEFFGHEGRNIYGVIGPETECWVILGAHYDTRPIADKDDETPDLPVLGANDGASGVAVLLELSRILKPSTLDCEIWLTFFDAEDSGGIEDIEWAYGATVFAEALEKFPDAVVIVDMVGDVDLNIYYERHSDSDLSGEIWNVALDQGFSGFIPEARWSIIDDHTPFLRLGITAVDIIDFDFPYHHTTQDTLDKVSSDSLEQVGRTLQVWLTEHLPLADSDG